MTVEPQVIRVFVCAPSRDLRAERAFLHETIFPEIVRRYEKHGIRFEIVDPRAGTAPEEETEGPAGLEQALAGIDRCRPYFLGILGQDYGRMLVEVPLEIGRKYPEVRNYARASRVHLEILHGVLHDPAEAGHSYFFFRRPEFLSQVPRADQEPFLAAHPSEAQGQVAARKLKTLKQAIGASSRPVMEYTCAWDRDGRRLTSLEAFGEQVAADLLDALPEEERHLGLVPPPAPALEEPPPAPLAAAPAVEPMIEALEAEAVEQEMEAFLAAEPESGAEGGKSDLAEEDIDAFLAAEPTGPAAEAAPVEEVVELDQDALDVVEEAADEVEEAEEVVEVAEETISLSAPAKKAAPKPEDPDFDIDALLESPLEEPAEVTEAFELAEEPAPRKGSAPETEVWDFDIASLQEEEPPPPKKAGGKPPKKGKGK